VRHKNTEEVFLVLQDEMERTYFPARHNDYRPPRIDIGDIVAAKLHSSQQWYRGIIMQKLSHKVFITAYKVMLLDAVTKKHSSSFKSFFRAESCTFQHVRSKFSLQAFAGRPSSR
jgi:hypothetical protein